MTESLVLDRYLPAYDHGITVARVFRAPPERVFTAIADLDLFRTPVAHLLLAARGVPARLAEAAARRRGERVAPEPPTFRLRDLPARGWTLLGEQPGRQLVYGFVGRPWAVRGAGELHARRRDPAAGRPRRDRPGQRGARPVLRGRRPGPELVGVRQIGDVVLLRCALSPPFDAEPSPGEDE